MKQAYVPLVVLCTCIVAVVSADQALECSKEVLECIRDFNGGSYAVSAWTTISILFKSEYSIVWYSEDLVNEHKLSCIRTKFGLFGSTDTYYRSCESFENVTFKVIYNVIDHTFAIKDYQGYNLEAYAIYSGKHCQALYVCSPKGATGPHIAVYCPTKELGGDEVTAEIEVAKTLFSKCNLNDGVALCTEKCS